MNDNIELVSIARYPVKSFPGETLESTILSEGRGLPLDRKWALATGTRPVPSDGSWTPCGAFERLTIRPSMAAWAIQSHSDGMPRLRGLDGEVLSFDENGWPIGPVRDPFVPDIRLAHAQNGYWDHADGLISIINLSTVEEIERLVGVPVDPARFRGNLYVRAAPWSEFGWLGRKLEFDDVELDIIRPIDRCRATSVRPGTGDVDVNIPAQLMRHFGHIYCGVYATVKAGGHVSSRSLGKVKGQIVGDQVNHATAQETAPPLPTWPRAAEVTDIIEEANGIRSVWFRDPLATIGSLDSYEAAQHIRLHALDGRATWRAYTISGVKDDRFRITVKRGSGNGSKAVHHLRVGDHVTISGPDGNLRLPKDKAPLMLLSAGIGITPSIAMLRALVAGGSQRIINVVHIARTFASTALWDEMESLTGKLINGDAQLWTTAGPEGEEQSLPDLALIAKHVASLDATVVMCGPDGFMKAAQQAFSNAGVPAASIQSEAFISPDVVVELRPPIGTGPFKVKFKTSNIVAEWTSADGTLLDLAEANGIVAPSHCRAGLCGTCRATVLSGRTESLVGASTDVGTVLTCCAAPLGPLEIDL
ncbi:2Fe-2S iron-sulfur cluster-binding protein [Thalassobius sp. I31.1]|uniref:2Fe-2S iron-sulfur cluster-binding protein n=1 Tax=Thalassobius sp. I31.1 TaxID=2109912 RepID=UPI000D1AFB42|nr:2Fe-2S iron-sulfur cluster-binding protein [Thalassobius sp. I31.1]